MDSGIQVFIFDHPLDLYQDAPIALTFAINDLKDLKNQSGNNSNQFKLINNSYNRNLTGFISDFKIEAINAYRQIPCKVVQNGLEIIPYGILSFQSCDSDTIDVVIYSGNVDFFDYLDIKLQDLGLYVDMSPYNHTFNLATIEAVALATDGYTYPLIDYGYLINVVTNPTNLIFGKTLNIPITYLRPAFFVKTLCQIIFKLTGYTAMGDLLQDPLFNALLMPFTNDKLALPPAKINLLQQYSVYAYKNIRQTIAFQTSQDNFYQIAFDMTTQNYIDPTVVYNTNLSNQIQATIVDVITPASVNFPFYTTSDNNFHTLYRGAYTINYTINITGGGSSGQHTLNPDDMNGVSGQRGSNKLQIQAYLLGQQPSHIPQAFTELNFGYVNGTLIMTAVGSFTLNAITGGTYGIWLYIPESHNYFDGNIEVNTTVNIIGADGIDLGEQDTIEMAGQFPDMTCREFLKSIFQRFGVICQSNPFNKTLNLVYFKTIATKNVSKAIDWSDKLLDQGEQLFYRLGAYSQTNYMRNADDSSVLANFGRDQIYIDDTNLPLLGDLFQSKFAGTQDIQLTPSLRVSQIRQQVNPAPDDSFSGSVSPRLLISNPGALTNNIVNITTQYLANGNLSSPLVTTYNPVNYLNTPLFKLPYVGDLSWTYLKNNYYQEYTYVLNYAKKLVVYLLLTELDILDLDLTIPIYLARYNANFYVNKVVKWIRGQRTQVELIKIS